MGDDESIAREYANFSGTGGKDQWEGWPNGGTSLVGSFRSNGNGVRIGIPVISAVVFCGAVLGTAIRSTCVWLSATSAILLLPTSTLVFVVWQD